MRLAAPAAFDGMARARSTSMRLRKDRHTEMVALHNCHQRAACLLTSGPQSSVAEALQVRLVTISVPFLLRGPGAPDYLYFVKSRSKIC